MSSDPITFTVYGKPQTAGSKRAFPFKRKSGNLGVRVSDDNEKSRSWKNDVAHKAVEAMDGRELLAGPLTVTMRFELIRPKGHFGTGRNAGKVKESADEYPCKKPDVLKLARAVEDALTGIIWRDDAQIVTETLEKRYGRVNCVHVDVLEETDDAD